MSTGWYIRKLKPRTVYDKFHIAKTMAHKTVIEKYKNGSDGWLANMSLDLDIDSDPRPSVYGMYDIRRLIVSGEYELVDEYGESYGTGIKGLKEFDRLVAGNSENIEYLRQEFR